MPDRLVRRLNGPRGSVLLAAAWVCALHGLAYTPLTGGPITPPLALDVLSRFVPLVVYGCLWFAAGALAAIGAFTDRRGAQRDHPDAWGYGVAAAMFSAWGMAYLGGWLIAVARGDESRAWITSGLYIAVAVIVAASARMTNPTNRKVRP